MREILFRGKAINREQGYHKTSYSNGDWVYGLVEKPFYEEFPNLPAEMRNTDGISGIEVDYETIGEYTGLTDKNGVKIFEGDIIKEDCGYEYQIGVVAFGNGYYDSGVCPFRGWFIDKFTLVREDEENDEDNFVFACNAHNSLLLIADEFEVIGNIYDNKDLLKEE